MCLKIEIGQKPVIAKSDVRCYKLVRKCGDMFVTIYRDYPVEIGKEYGSSFSSYIDSFDNVECIERGLHSLTNLKHAKKLRTTEKNNFGGDYIIVKCTIPKGSTYYTGWFGSKGQFKSYVSDVVVYNEII